MTCRSQICLAALLMSLGLHACDRPPAEEAGAAPATELEAPPDFPPPPALDALDRSIRVQYESMREGLEEAWASAATPAERAAAVGAFGRWYHAYGIHPVAVDAYRRAAALEPSEPRWIYLLASLDRLDGRFEAASAGYARVAESTAPVPYLPALVWRATIELEHHRLEAARALFGRVLELSEATDGAAVLARHGLARVALADERPDAALAELDQALEVAPDASVLLYAAARAARAQGDAAGAEAYLARLPADNRAQRRLALADPWLHEVESLRVGVLDHLRAGLEARRAGRLAEALEHLERAVASDGDNLEARLQLAQLHLDLQRPRAAAPHLAAAAERDPERPRIAVLQARTAVLLGDLEAAEAILAAALENHPEDVTLRLSRAEVDLRAGRGQAALAALKSLRREHPEDPQVARAEVLALALLGLHEAARAAVVAALERMPGQPELEALRVAVGGS
ncbi:MAG: tetratricopeptide repeat protein [Acidobacteriota bacterium]